MTEDHDPLCLYQSDGYGDSCEVCRCISEARSEERERIAAALEAWDGWDTFGLSGWDLLHDAIMIVRGEAS